jgi:hypothetical protein
LSFIIFSWTLSIGWTQSQYPITACDVNGDGYEDIVGFGYSGKLYNIRAN